MTGLRSLADAALLRSLQATRRGPVATEAPADCEAFSGGWLEQGANAWSSLGYVVVGAVIVVAALRRRLPLTFVVFGAATVAEGIGSVLYHGRPGDAAQAVHDVALLAMLGFVAGWHAGRLFASSTAGSLAGTAVGLVGGSVAFGSGGTNVVVGVGVTVTVAAELVARRRRLTPVWGIGLVIALVVALVTWVAGTADSPLCAAESPWQWHAVWHLASAGVMLLWADAAAGAERTPAPRLTRRGLDRALGLAARLLGHTFFRSIEVVDDGNLPRDRPVLLVVNHPNGFVDPVVVAAALGRMPRFLAKAALWKVLPARPLLALVGALPVYRRADGDVPDANVNVFAACHESLAAGATVAIFPEGTTGDRPALDSIKSGAARIALGAVEAPHRHGAVEAPHRHGAVASVDDLAIVPIGVAFESRIATRPRAVLVIGEAIAFDDLDSADPAAVAELTDRIAASLADVSPEFEIVEQREMLRAAATVVGADRHRYRTAPFSEVETMARRVAAAPPAARASVDLAFRDYATQLQLVGLTEAQIARRIDRRSLAVAVVVAVLFGSVVLTATVIHLPAIVLILVATAAVRSTATKGTVRVLVGLPAGIITWAVFGMVTADGAAAVVAAVIVAVEGQVALLIWPSFAALAARCWGWLRTRDRGDLMGPVLASRSRLVTSMVEAGGCADD